MRLGRWGLMLLLGLPSCGTAPASAEQLRLEQRRLLAPFLQPVQVTCADLVVECTANFHGNVGQPAVDARAHDMRKEEGQGYVDTIWVNRTGQASTALTVTLGERAEFTEQGLVRGPQTRFFVQHRVRLRVWRDQRALALDAQANGQVVLRWPGKAPETRLGYRVSDGAVRQP